MSLVSRSIVAAMFAAAVWVPSVSAQEQPSPPAQAQPGATDPAPDLSDKKLDAAAAALNEVATVKNEYQQKIEAAPAPDKERIVNEANGKLVKAVTDQGLTVDEYNSILVVAQNDPGVREKIFQRLRPTK